MTYFGGMGKKDITKNLSRAALDLAEGLFSNTFDIALWFAAYFAEMSSPQSASGQTWRAQVAADRFLNQINYDVIKRAISEARRRGLIKKSAKRRAPLEITREGKRRLSSLIPKYDEQRVWDGRMHLVTYDIPEKQADNRRLLREYLIRIGGGRLQDSVWITPYNPIDTLRTLIDEKSLGGTVVISDLGKDGSIGEEDIHALVVRIFKLEVLDQRYEEWLEKVERVDHWALIKYFSILRDDPQLPFPLLPVWWKGDKVYRKVKFQLHKLSI